MLRGPARALPCAPMGAPLSSCGMPEWGCGELLIRQMLVPVLSCPVLSHPSGTKRGECCDLQGTINILFQSLDTSLSSQKLAMFMEEIHCWRFWKLARICTIKLIKPLKKHSNSTEVSCCTASFPEEAVCIFKSVCKSFKSVLLQPQRVLQCSQKNCKEEIVNPWYSA